MLVSAGQGGWDGVGQCGQGVSHQSDSGTGGQDHYGVQVLKVQLVTDKDVSEAVDKLPVTVIVKKKIEMAGQFLYIMWDPWMIISSMSPSASGLLLLTSSLTLLVALIRSSVEKSETP